VTAADVIHLLVALILLSAVSVGAGRLAGLSNAIEVCVVVVRALVQVLVVAEVVRFVFSTPAFAPLYIAVMVGAASFTSSARLRKRGVPGALVPAAASIVAGSGITLGLVMVTAALPWQVRQLVPFTAQVIGGAMTATTLASTRMLDEVLTRWDVVEGWLAIGAQPRQAVRELAVLSAGAALVPALDQTRNVGLVVLPGAFVGLLLGGASPLQAARIQLLVLVGLIAAESVAAVAVTYLLSDRLGSAKPAKLEPAVH
jgi:putative ABC transport system permease protein